MLARRYVFGPFTLDAARGALLRDGDGMAVGHRAIALLLALVEADGQVVRKEQLIEAAWPRAVVEDSNLSVQIAALRRLLGPTGDGGDYIATVARVGYRFCAPVRSVGEDAAQTVADANRPSIAVLPLVNLSGDPQQEYIADGISEDIIMALSRFRWFRVSGRGSSFAFKGRAVPVAEAAQQLNVRYLLEGSVRRSAPRVTVSLQLTDAATDSFVWGERYDFDSADMPAVQDRIAQQIAGAIEPELLQLESAQAARRTLRDATTQDLVHRGTYLFHQVRRASHHQARELFRQACRLEPSFAPGQLWLARVSAGLVAYGWSESESADLAEGMVAAVHAINADGKNPYSHYAMAITSVFAGEFEQAMRAAQRAVELAPGFALGHLVLGMARLYGGDAQAAVEPLRRGLSLNPFDPQNFVWQHMLATACLLAGEAEQALECARRAQEIRPDWRPAFESAARCLVVLGRCAAARECLWRAQALPAASDALAPLRRRHPVWDNALGRWLSEAAQAGSQPE